MDRCSRTLSNLRRKWGYGAGAASSRASQSKVMDFGPRNHIRCVLVLYDSLVSERLSVL